MIGPAMACIPFLLCAFTALLAHDPEGRIAELTARTARSPQDAALWRERAHCHAQVHERRLALADYERALALAPEDAQALVGAAELDYALGNDVRALARVETALLRAPTQAGARWLRARLRAATGDRTGALADYRALLDATERPAPDLVLECAQVLVASGSADDRDAARRVLDRALEQLGPVVALTEAAAGLDLAVGDCDRALSRWGAVMAHAQRPAIFRERRAQVLERFGRTAEAAAERLLQRMPPAATRPPAVAAASAAPPQSDCVLAEQVLLPPGSVWRYRDDNSITGSAWIAPGFDDSSWSQGPAQLGYGDGDEATVVGYGPSSSNRYVTTWFRTHLTIPDPSVLATARIGLLVDDGAVVYLNGVEVVRTNLPAGAILPATLALLGLSGTAESTFQSYAIDPQRLVAGDNVVAVEVHQSSPSSSDISFDLTLLASPDPVAVVRGPYLQNATGSSAVIRWRTNAFTDTRVWLGPSPQSLALVHADAARTAEHAATVANLAPDTRYYYAIGDAQGVRAGADAEHYLQTLPTAGSVRPLRVWALGDAGTGSNGQRAVRDAYLAYAGNRPAEAVLLLGDNAYSSGTDAEYQAGIFDVYQAVLRKTCTWSTLGNHDAGSAASATQSGVYYDTFTLPASGEAGGLPSGTEAYYSFDRGHVHFVCLDSQDSNRTAAGAMLQWLQADLGSTNAAWVIAFFHHPPYTKGTHDSDVASDSGARMIDMRQAALPILEANGVDLVLCGHSHTYERSYLLDGHYGDSTTLQPVMVLDRGDGEPSGDGSYAKPHTGHAPHEGAVYVVAGSAGQSGGGSLDHPAMHISLPTMGSLVVDIDGDRLDAAFVTDTGSVADRFSVQKGWTPMLQRDLPELPVAGGGRQTLTLATEASCAGQIYLIGGSFGTAPGFALAGQWVPLNPDWWLSASLSAANSALYPGSFGVLDAQGGATAGFVLPPNAGSFLLGASLYHAAIVVDGGGGIRRVSNAVRVRFVP